jgi:hypothetical protein
MRLSTLPALAFVLACVAAPSRALSFRVIENDGFKRRILLIYDCGSLDIDPECLPHEEQFAAGTVYEAHYGDDSSLRQRLERRLRASGFQYAERTESKAFLYRYAGDKATLPRWGNLSAYSEIWLRSGGGHVVAGLGLGEAFRSQRATVRVPGSRRMHEAGISLAPFRNPSCVSSYTVAFLGGLFRYIDPDATYQVHAASSVLDLSEKRAADYRQKHAGGGFRKIADEIWMDAFGSVRKFLAYFHATLLLSYNPREVAAELDRRDMQLQRWFMDSPNHFPYDAAVLARDEAIYRLEGDAALQDIVMRLEREANHRAIASLRQRVPDLGRRAGAALDMIDAMFDTSSIKTTNVMARETLVRMGYITEDVK